MHAPKSIKITLIIFCAKLQSWGKERPASSGLTIDGLQVEMSKVNQLKILELQNTWNQSVLLKERKRNSHFYRSCFQVESQDWTWECWWEKRHQKPSERIRREKYPSARAGGSFRGRFLARAERSWNVSKQDQNENILRAGGMSQVENDMRSKMSKQEYCSCCSNPQSHKYLSNIMRFR